MFDANSRYSKCKVVEVEATGQKTVRAVSLRRLPYEDGNLTEVKGTDRLDIMAHRRYKDATRFWHIADANTELEANDLIEHRRSENPLASQGTRYIPVPEN